MMTKHSGIAVSNKMFRAVQESYEKSAHPSYGLTAAEIARWRFVERKGEDVIQRCATPQPALADPYPTLKWDEDETAIVVLKTPGQPWWVRYDDRIRFDTTTGYFHASNWQSRLWDKNIAFQIKRRPVLTPAEPQLLLLLSAATDDEAVFIRSAARRANIELPE